VPQTVHVTIQLLMSDIFFASLTSPVVPLTASVSYPYLGK
jgi:hypothetical protein